MSDLFELSIKEELLRTSDPVQGARNLMRELEFYPEQLADPNIVNSLARFLYLRGLDGELLNFVKQHIHNDRFQIPWKYFFGSLVRQSNSFGARPKLLIDKVMQEKDIRYELAHIPDLALSLPEVKKWEDELLHQRSAVAGKTFSDLYDRLMTYRSSQLENQERQLLQKMIRMFPLEKKLVVELKEQQERYAEEVLRRKINRRKMFLDLPIAREEKEVSTAATALSQAMILHSRASRQTAADLCIAAIMMELYDTALEICNTLPESRNSDWLRAEILLRNHRHIELLTTLNELEQKYSDSPETFAATAYLRAQAHWGLSQKTLAIDIMEALLQSEPDYRAGIALLTEWKSHA